MSELESAVDTSVTPAQAVDTAPEIKITDDGNQITRGDAKYIRAEALAEARANNAALKAQIDQMAPFIPEFTEFLHNKRNGRTAAVTTAVGSGGDDDYSEDELKGVAQLRGYYSEDGQSLDLNRARLDLRLMDQRAARQARTAIDPVVRTTAADRAARNRQEAMTRQFDDGAPIADPRYINQAFQALPEDLAADPGVGQLVQVLAAGMEYLDIRKSGRTPGPRREPNYTEGSTGRVDNGQRGGGLSAFALRAAQSRGYTADQWAKLQDKPTPDARPDRDGGYVLETGL